MRETYHTRQQDDLRHILEQAPGTHYTASQLQELLIKEGHPIGLATIYRQLDRMVSDGIVHKYSLETNDSACYEFIGEGTACVEQYHCKCEQCGKLIHMDCEELTAIREHILKHHGFSWNAGKTVFYGVCDQCRNA